MINQWKWKLAFRWTCRDWQSLQNGYMYIGICMYASMRLTEEDWVISAGLGTESWERASWRKLIATRPPTLGPGDVLSQITSKKTSSWGYLCGKRLFAAKSYLRWGHDGWGWFLNLVPLLPLKMTQGSSLKVEKTLEPGAVPSWAEESRDVNHQEQEETT